MHAIVCARRGRGYVKALPPSQRTGTWPSENAALRRRGSPTIRFDPDKVGAPHLPARKADRHTVIPRFFRGLAVEFSLPSSVSLRAVMPPLPMLGHSVSQDQGHSMAIGCAFSIVSKM